MSTTPLETARKMLQSIVAKKAQFGRMYLLQEDNEYSGDVILESIRTVLQHADFESDELKDKNLTLVKQMRAAKAREGKLKKANVAFKATIKDSDKLSSHMSSEINELSKQVTTLKAEVDRLEEYEWMYKELQQ